MWCVFHSQILVEKRTEFYISHFHSSRGWKSVARIPVIVLETIKQHDLFRHPSRIENRTLCGPTPGILQLQSLHLFSNVFSRSVQTRFPRESPELGSHDTIWFCVPTTASGSVFPWESTVLWSTGRSDECCPSRTEISRSNSEPFSPRQTHQPQPSVRSSKNNRVSLILGESTCRKLYPRTNKKNNNKISISNS